MTFTPPCSPSVGRTKVPSSPSEQCADKSLTPPRNSWAPPPSRGVDAAFSSFAAPSYGNRNESKTSHIRVVARIRPLTEEEDELGDSSAIFPIIQNYGDDVGERGLPPRGNLRVFSPVASTPTANHNKKSFFSPENEVDPCLGGVASKVARFDSPSPRNIGRMPVSATSTNLPSPVSALNTTPQRRNTRGSLSPMRARGEGFYQPPSPLHRFPLMKSNGFAQSLTVGVANRKQFDYDAVFDSTTSQKEVYDRTVGDAVRRNIFRGFNTTIIAYGQTGSGKTHSMEGSGQVENPGVKSRSNSVSETAPRRMSTTNISHDNGLQDQMHGSATFRLSENDGIIPRAVHDLFKAKQRHASAGEITISLSYLEIYQDEVRDLLVDSSENLKLRDQGDLGIVVKGLTSINVESARQANALINEATRRRTVNGTGMNKSSSRSHTMCTLSVMISPSLDVKNQANNMSNLAMSEYVRAKLTLVDLAGSERLKRSAVEGIKQQESININKDLFVLGKVVSALADQCEREEAGKIIASRHIPYRDSKLTRLLRDSLGGNCCTVMIACISPAVANLDESMNTLRYAERSRTITNTIKQNVTSAILSPEESAAMRKENNELKSQLFNLTKRLNILEKARKKDRVAPWKPYEFGENDSVSDEFLAKHSEKIKALMAEVDSGLKVEMESTSTPHHHCQASMDWKNQFESFLASSSLKETTSNEDDLEGFGSYSFEDSEPHSLTTLVAELQKADEDLEADDASTASGLTQENFSADEASISTKDSQSKSSPSNQCDSIKKSISDQTPACDLTEQQALRDRLENEVFALQEKLVSLRSERSALLQVAPENKSDTENFAPVSFQSPDKQAAIAANANKNSEFVETQLNDLRKENWTLQTETKTLVEHVDAQRRDAALLSAQLRNQKLALEREEEAIKTRKAKLDKEIREKEIIRDRIQSFSQSGSEYLGCEAMALKMENRTLSAQNKRLSENITTNMTDLALLQRQIDKKKMEVEKVEADTMEKIQRENQDLHQESDDLAKRIKERKLLLASLEVQIETKKIELANLKAQILELKEALQLVEEDGKVQANDIDNAISARVESLQNIEIEAKNLSNQVRMLAEDRHHLMKAIEGCQEISDISSRLNEEQDARANLEKEMKAMKKEIDDLKSERDLFRVKADVQEEAARKLQNEVSSLSDSRMSMFQGNQPKKDNFLRSRSEKWKKEEDRGGVLTEINCVSTAESNISSVYNDSDNASVLFGQENIIGGSFSRDEDVNVSTDQTFDYCDSESLQSDHKAIRAHASKMLFWANKSIERKRLEPRSSSASSVASSVGSYMMPKQNGVMVETSRKSSSNPALPPRIIVRSKISSTRSNEEGSICAEVKPVGSMISTVASTFDESVDPSISDDDGPCKCSNSIFSGNAQHVEFYLPKLGMACACGKSKVREEHERRLKANGDDPLLLVNILRPWQVEFLESIGVTRAEHLCRAQKRNPDGLAKGMRYWRHEQKLKSIKTKSCAVALHIWARTCIGMLRAERQKKQNKQVLRVYHKEPKKKMVLPLDGRTSSFADNDDDKSISTLGCDEMDMQMEI